MARLRRGEDLYFLRLRVTSAAMAAVALAALSALAIFARMYGAVRRLAGRRPRIVWGDTPIVNIKYWSAAVAATGYPSRTIVTHVYPSNDHDDFDVVRDDWLAAWPRMGTVRDYLLFGLVLWTSDVVTSFFDGGFLKTTPLAHHEVRLLHLAGCKLVVTPFGSDIAVRGSLGVTETAFAAHYPALLEQSDTIRERVDRLCASSDLVVKTFQVGYLPRHDAFWSHALAVDTEHWRPEDGTGARHEDGPTLIVHAPNHRQLKGTEAVISAVDELRREGFDVSLVLLEQRPNEEVRDALRAADIAVDQLLAGYGLFAVECLASGVPVISNLRWMPDEMRRQSVIDSPIIDADEADVLERLRELVVDADLRRQIGRASRRFALAYHSYEVSGSVWCEIFDHVWTGRPLRPDLAPLSFESSIRR